MPELNEHDISEVIDQLDQLENSLLEFEGRIAEYADHPGLVHILFRIAHNLKSKMLMIDKPACGKLLHAFENRFDRIRKNLAAPDRDLIDTCLLITDKIRSSVSSDFENTAELEEMEKRLSQEPSAAAPSSSPQRSSHHFSPEQLEKLASSKRDGEFLYRLDKSVMSSLAESDFLQLPVYEDIRAAENLVLTYPPFRDWDRSRTETVIQVFFTSRKTQNELENLLFDPFTRIDYPENLSATTGAAPSLPDTRKAPVKSALKFLLVEDNTDAAMFLQEMLSDIAICDTAMLVSEALDKFAIAMKYEIPYDVILLDITLPDGEGLEVLQAVRKMEAEKKIYGQSQCKVLMTTALNDSEHIIRSFRDQCDAYLVKPLTLKALKKELVKLKVLPS